MAYQIIASLPHSKLISRWRTEPLPRFIAITKDKRQSRLLEAVHESASDMQRLGFIEKRYMEKYDALCLEPLPEYDAAAVRALRSSDANEHEILKVGIASVEQFKAQTMAPRQTRRR
ncbi:MAG TPA: hypothetical protein VJS30_27730 [Paraburkholderia sp.]|nr:hypothetical protein [Paraburkholderia sp.]